MARGSSAPRTRRHGNLAQKRWEIWVGPDFRLFRLPGHAVRARPVAAILGHDFKERVVGFGGSVFAFDFRTDCNSSI